MSATEKHECPDRPTLEITIAPPTREDRRADAQRRASMPAFANAAWAHQERHPSFDSSASTPMSSNFGPVPRARNADANGPEPGEDATREQATINGYEYAYSSD